MSDSTTIESLPAPSGGVSMNIQERTPVQSQIASIQPMNAPTQPKIVPPHPPIVMNTTSNSVENNTQAIPFAPSQIDTGGLDKAMNRITELPSRDIPMNTTQITNDAQIKPNYLPQQDAKHYIEEHDTYNSMVEQNKQKEQQQDRLDLLYDEFQLPILIMVLFFIFQLPFIQKKLTTFFPTIFLTDGNMSMSGYVVKTILFGVSFYVLVKLINYSSEL